jgi:Skp family chaperone for outer membrane proteins
MKTRYLKLSIFLFTCLWITNAALAQTKIATVNLQKVFDRYWKTKRDFAQFQNRANELETQRSEISHQYQKANGEYTKLLDGALDSALSEPERAKRKQAAEAKLSEVQVIEAQIKKFDTDARDKLGKQRQTMMETILSDIREATKIKATAAGYDIVWDASARGADGGPIILFTNPQKDLSDEIISHLNKGAPAEFLPTTEKK